MCRYRLQQTPLPQVLKRKMAGARLWMEGAMVFLLFNSCNCEGSALSILDECAHRPLLEPPGEGVRGRGLDARCADR